MTSPQPVAQAPIRDGLRRLATIPARTAALVGALLALPIGLLFLAVRFGLQPLSDALRAVLTDDGAQANAIGQAYVVIGLLLLPVALAVAAWPMLRRGPDGRRSIWPLNLVVVAVVVVLVAATWGELGMEIVRCDVLGIPNCD